MQLGKKMTICTHTHRLISEAPFACFPYTYHRTHIDRTSRRRRGAPKSQGVRAGSATDRRYCEIVSTNTGGHIRKVSRMMTNHHTHVCLLSW